MSTTGDLGLYVHIPFCTKKCPYCSFYVIPHSKKNEEILLHALQKEWEKKWPEINQKKIVTIYFGGGTPALSPAIILSFLQWVEKRSLLDPAREITVEANPETLSETTLYTLAQAGVNRLSIGVQSFHDESLKVLGRTHTKDKALEAIRTASRYIPNISIDLMFDLPEEDLTSLEKSISYLPTLPITHLSIYNLSIEPHTLFFKKKDQLIQPSPQESKKHMDFLFSYLEQIGLERYEISAFCKDGKFSRHNCRYWKNQDVVGFGPSATSYFQKKRSKTLASLLRYATRLEQGESILEYEERLPEEKRKRLEICLGLRMMEGVEISSSDPIWEEIDPLIDKKLLENKGNRVQLTKEGVYFHDYICSELI